MDVSAQLDALRKSQPDWAALPASDRARVVARFVRRLHEHRQELEDLLVSESGKSATDAAMELPMVLQIAAYYGRNAPSFLAARRVRTSSWPVATKRATAGWRPHGVVGIISPWNYPLANPLMDGIPALLAGNAVLLKPSELTPLVAEAIQRHWISSGAPAVLEIAHGGPEVGEAVVDGCDFVQFTGSTRIGRVVMERAARTLTPVSLELGGKDAMVVLHDADVVRAARGAVWGGFFNAGQTCIAVERVYVDRRIHPQFVEAVVAETTALALGEGTGHDVGRMINEQQKAVVEAHLADAITRGGRVLAGGTSDGLLVAPTVIDGADHSMTAMTEETFGPLLPIMAFDDEDEALRLAGDSPYGLSASIWTKDVPRARRLAAKLDVGTVLVNDVISHMMVLGAPMGGRRASGLGSRLGGAAGLTKYCRPEVVVVARLAGRTEPNWYAASPRLQRLGGRLLSGAALRRLPRE